MRTQFHSLRVAGVEPLTDDSAAITFAVPDELAGLFAFAPGQSLTIERDGERLELCVRGDRLDSPSAFSLDHERTFQTLLSERGIRVARVHGWHDADPKAYVMDRVPGRDNFDGVSEDERRSAMEDYVDILLEMHQLDVRPADPRAVIGVFSLFGTASALDMK